MQRGKTQYLVKWDGTRSPEWNDADLVIYYGGETHINKYLKKQSRQNRVQLHAVVPTEAKSSRDSSGKLIALVDFRGALEYLPLELV